MFVAVPLVLIVLLAFLVLIVVSRPNRQSETMNPSCGACGYNVVGLETMTCPECGGDLRIVGIVTSHTPRADQRLLAGMIGFTLLLGFVGIAVSGVLLSIAPTRCFYQEHVLLKGPVSGAYREAVVRAHGTTWRTRAIAIPVEILLTPNLAHTAAGSAAVTPIPIPQMIVSPDGSYEYVTETGARAHGKEGFGSEAVLDLMKGTGVRVFGESLREESSRIVAEARIVARKALQASDSAAAGDNYATSSGSDAMSQFADVSSIERVQHQTPPLLGIVLGVFWLLVWISGLRFLRKGQSMVAA